MPPASVPRQPAWPMPTFSSPVSTAPACHGLNTLSVLSAMLLLEDDDPLEDEALLLLLLLDLLLPLSHAVLYCCPKPNSASLLLRDVPAVAADGSDTTKMASKSSPL